MFNPRIKGGDKTANSNGAAASLVISGHPGQLFSLSGMNTGPDQYIQLHDAAALPADGATAKLSFFVQSGGFFSKDFTTGRNFAIGIVVCNSTAALTKTIGAADCQFDATYDSSPTVI